MPRIGKKGLYCTGQYTKTGAQKVAEIARSKGCSGVCIRKRTDEWGEYWLVYADR